MAANDTTATKQETLLADLQRVGRGMLIGTVDVGTMLLVFGLYERVVTAFAAFDGECLSLVRQGEWRKAAEKTDLRFLVTLFIGIILGLVSIGSAVNALVQLDATRPFILAILFGVNFATGLLVAWTIKPKSLGETGSAWALGLVWVAIAAGLSMVNSGQFAPSYWYLFLCGIAGSAAMILPGFNGAMLLFVLGVYIHLTDIPRHLLQGQEVPGSLASLVIFAAGCGFGLLFLCHSLKWLLEHFHNATVASMTGIIFGSLWKLWPFQTDTTPAVTDFKQKLFENTLPSADLQTALIFGTLLAAGAAVVATDWYVRNYFPETEEKAETLAATEPARKEDKELVAAKMR